MGWQDDDLAAPPTAPTTGWQADAPAGPSPQQKAVVKANDNGEEAARALGVAKRTGIPAPLVHSDLPGYSEFDRNQTAIKYVNENPFLAKYVDGNPMAASVSADDYKELDEASQTLQALHPELVRGKAQVGLWQGVPEIAGMLGTVPGREKLLSALKDLPGALLKGLIEPLLVPGKVAAGKVDLTTEEGMDQAISLGLGIALGAGGGKGTMKTGPAKGLEGVTDFGALAGNDVAIQRAAKEAGINIRPVPQTFEDFMHTLGGMKTRQEIDDFIASKHPGPPGAMLQIEHAKAGAEALDKAVETAQGSKTKERSPELFAEMANGHDTGDVHVDGQKIMELYEKEGKAPAEGDGLFGFVPDIAAKAQAAAATGGEVTIPVGDYVAHIDEAVHKTVGGSVRLHDDGVTLEEAKEHEKAIEAWHGTPHDFEQFDLTKIGTGEGAQVYGHGLYFAQNQKVGEGYRDSLAPGPSVDTQRFNANDPIHIAAEAIHATGHIDDAQVALETRLAKFNDKNDPFEAERGKLKQAIKELDNIASTGKPSYDPGTKGQLYKVSIAADPTHFLDWDVPLLEQKAIIDKIAAHDVLGRIKIKSGENEGGDFYYSLITHHEYEILEERTAGGTAKNSEAPARASKMLAEAGIPGIKYLDQGSRGGIPDKDAMLAIAKAQDELATTTDPARVKVLRDEIAKHEAALKPTRNFVVFNDRMVKITEKNGDPVAALLEHAVEAEKLLMGMKTTPFMNMLFQDEKAVGITEGEIKRYSELIAGQEQAVLDKAVAAGKREASRRLAPEWKRNEATLKGEVTNELTNSGAFAAEKYLRDHKIDIAHDNAAVVADGLAPHFGFETGQDLLRGLQSIETERAASGKGPQVQLRDAIKEETASRMEAKYGNLAANIAKEARQIALAEHSFDVMAEEVRLLAKANGVAPPLSRTELVAWAQQTFEASNIRDAGNWEKHRRAVERGGRETEKALLKKDWQEAFDAKQRQMLAAEVAKQSLALQRVIDGAESKLRRFSSEETIKSLDQAHLEQLRQMFASVGLPQHFAPLRDTVPLRDFVAESQGQLAIAPWLMDGSQPKLQDMSVAQFRDFVKSMQSIENAGRKAVKLENAYGEALLQNVVVDVVKSLKRFPFIDQPQNAGFIERTNGVGRYVVGAHLLVERVFDYTDKFDPHGPLTEWVDRPLRDANAKEIVLTEQVTRMLRDLKQHVDSSINDPIENKLIPDANDKSGFLRMDRGNLRQLMLNMGNWSNMKKLVEGFGVNEADLRQFVDKHATAKDIAWVNGIWGVFKHLKPEADAVQLRDTGVPVDSIPAVPWDIKDGSLEGGYYPLSYDAYNSDIQGHIARPLFDKGYFAATTPHGYTEARTGYKGAIDLTGLFLSSKIQGMVHDIAFREAVRNADKLLSNQEFRTAVSQYWGKEVVDLLPGWIRDIANSHNLDDNYSQGFVRASALVRQNVVSTLIAFNPGTFIKHGFTAALMSMDRVGLGKLLSATGEIGLTGAAKNAWGLISKDDRVPDEAFMQSFRDLLDQGQRGNNARQFVLDSSAVMRNRQRQYEDSIRGSVDAITNSGISQTLADFRQRAMQYGRLAVAFSDQMSAMPTWLAAYKKAYAAGETHADAVFIADKEVSRAHGSNFVGDQPAVTRLGNTGTGELGRWFTTLYKFWNHQQNNQYQLAWDASAKLGGREEPGANYARISREVGIIIGLIAIEEMSTAAKDEDHHGLLLKMLLPTVRYLGNGYVGLRELTNGLAMGREPSVGMIGALTRAVSESVTDLAKETGIKHGIAKKWIIHTATLLGVLTGGIGTQAGKTAQGLVNYANRSSEGQPKRPDTWQGFNDWRQLLRTGSTKARVH